MTWKLVTKMALAVIKPLMKIITPQLEGELEKFLLSFHKKAYATENPWDDLLADFLLEIFDIEAE